MPRVMIPSTRQGPCSGSAREESTPGVTAKTSGVLSAGTSEKQVKNSEGGRHSASARQSHRARRRCGNPITSAGRGRDAELLRGGVGCPPGVTGANGVADGRKSFPSTLFPGHRRGFRASGSSARRPMPHAGWKRLSSAKNLVPVLRRCCFMVGFFENLAKLPARTASSQTRSQTASSKLRTPRQLLERARVWRRHNELLGAAVLEKSGLFRHHKLLRVRIRHVVHDKRRGGTLRKAGGGLPEQHHVLR